LLSHTSFDASGHATVPRIHTGRGHNRGRLLQSTTTRFANSVKKAERDS
jgi:hypothetical protein